MEARQKLERRLEEAMDIKSIIDADPSTSTPKRPAQSNRDDNRHEIRPTLQTSTGSFQSPYGVPPPVYNVSRDGRPPQPPPLQAPGHNDFRSPSVSSYHSIQSPYQPTPTSAVSGGQYPFPLNQHQSPYAAQGSHYSQRDGHPVGPHQSPMNVSYSQYGQPTPMPQTPTATTPGSSQTYYNQGRPPSSHSVTTPTSAQPQAPQIPRQSPSTSHAQIRGQAQSFSTQQYLSQPGTPLGPPANFARSSTNLRRESPGSYGHSRNHSGGSYSHNSISVPSPSTEHPGSAFNSPSTIGHKQAQSSGRRHSTSLDRERSLSVSPKTRLPSQPKTDILKGAADPYYAQRDLYSAGTRDSEHYRSETGNGHAQPANQTPSRSFSLEVSGILNAPMVSEHDRQTKELSGSATTISPQVITPPNRPPLHMRIPSQSDSRDMPDAVPSDVTPSKLHSTAQQTIHDRQSLHMSRTATEIASFQDRPTLNPSPHQADSMPSIPSQDKMSASVQSKLADIKAEDKEPPASANQSSARKRRREEPIPVYAQSSRSGPSNNPFLLGKRPVKATPPVKREQSMGNDLLRQTPVQASRPDTNGHTIPNNDVQIPTAHPPVPRGGLLGPWEPSILNHIPYEEVTKFVSDFLFNEVVLRHDVGVASNKGVHSQAAVLEIEAKIGQLKDTAYGTRLHLPVMSECVFCVTDPKYKTKFESSMTEVCYHCLFFNKLAGVINSQLDSTS